ncbi:hypothetical protein H5410_013929 [Solanum commersonii]|uniref:Uncharacterized protein n=1 Tax=Solanum commersonii TaxID=4109 RepID=A0A9J5ZPK4_SOLCO|nr:hypothetical protein H5410_013929 [Solanum commersonii]
MSYICIRDVEFTLRSGTTEKSPRKLTTKRKVIIHPKEGFLTLSAAFASVDCLAITSLMPKR